MECSHRQGCRLQAGWRTCGPRCCQRNHCGIVWLDCPGGSGGSASQHRALGSRRTHRSTRPGDGQRFTVHEFAGASLGCSLCRGGRTCTSAGRTLGSWNARRRARGDRLVRPDLVAGVDSATRHHPSRGLQAGVQGDAELEPLRSTDRSSPGIEPRASTTRADRLGDVSSPAHPLRCEDPGDPDRERRTLAVGEF